MQSPQAISCPFLHKCASQFWNRVLITHISVLVLQKRVSERPFVDELIEFEHASTAVGIIIADSGAG